MHKHTLGALFANSSRFWLTCQGSTMQKVHKAPEPARQVNDVIVGVSIYKQALSIY